MTKAKRIRKPRDMSLGGTFLAMTNASGTPTLFHSGPVEWRPLDKKDCRRLAAWLEKAADWLEQQEGK